MKSKRLRVGIVAGSLVLVGALFTGVAGAGSSWLLLPANFFGFGGDFFDVSRITLPNNKDEVQTSRFVPLAANRTYMVPDRSGATKSVTIGPTDQGALLSTFGLDLIRVFYSKAAITDHPAGLADPDGYTQKSWAIFMAAQAAIACNSVTVYSDTSSGSGSVIISRKKYTATVEVLLCSDGSFPVNGQAAYAHGIRGGQ